MADPWAAWREEFPILETTTYLVSNSLGAMPRAVRSSLERYAEAWDTRSVRAWEEGWWDMAVALGDKIAPLIGAAPGTISLHPNVTLIQAIVASCFSFQGKRRKVVLTDREFPSLIYFWRAQRGRGAEVQLVTDEEEPDRLPLDKFLAAIDSRTLLVVVSHVLFRNGALVDVQPVAEKAHRVGARVLVDTYHSAGILPVEVGKWKVDFAVGGALKWLCGGPGVAYLYVRPDLLARLEPGLTGWFAHPRPFDFEVLAGPLRADAFRFLNGTPHIPAFYAAEPGLDIVGEVGVPRIRRRSLQLTGRLLEAARARGWKIRTPPSDDARGGTVVVDVPRGPQVLRELLRRSVLVDYRAGAGIRISPHFYNTEGEVDRAVAEIDSILAV